MLTQRRLKRILHYDRKTGEFTWLVQRGSRITPGMRAGCPNGAGYIVIHVNYILYHAHRLAWFYCYGKWPRVIDHINRKRNDNRLCNLRHFDYSKNSMNQNRYRISKSNQRGIHWRGGAWGRLMRNGERSEYGPFASLKKATAVANKVGSKIWGELWEILQPNG